MGVRREGGMNVAVCGLWHLGSVTAACVAKHFPVVAFDPSPENIESLSHAKPPVAEPGLSDLVNEALEVFQRPERIVAGVRSAADRSMLEPLLLPFCENIEWMSVESAEMVKHSINAFLATSVSFINEIATVCERVGADAKEVERGLK